MTTVELSPSLRQEILDVEAKRIAAMVALDIPTLSSILADDLLYTHSGGRQDTKASFLELVVSPDSQYLGVDYSGVEVRPCGDALAVRGRAQIRLQRANGDKVSYPIWFLDVYAKRDGRWQMVSWQATRIPE